MFFAFITHVKNNWKSGLTVALVSIPLSVSLAVASQTAPAIGVLTAIWAACVAAFLGGSNFNIIGPTGALSGILASYAILHGSDSLAALALVAGFFILLAYFLKLHRYIVFIPGSTIHGFTLGVAFIIGLNQLNFMLGLNNLPRHSHFIDNVIESLKHLSDAQWSIFLLFLIFLGLLFFCKRFVANIPGAILITPLGLLIGFLSVKQIIPLNLETLGSRYGSIHVSFIQMPHLFIDFSLVTVGTIVALIAILETMISAKIADGLTRTKHNQHREMFGLGIANIVTGLVGGMPATAALARTALNIKSGAKHRFSQGLCALFITLISFMLLPYFTYLPLIVIAAILVYVAIAMIEREHFVRLYQYDKANFMISLFVASMTIFYDPVIGILFGVALSLLLFMRQLSYGYFELEVQEGERIIPVQDRSKLPAGNVFVYAIKGPLVYINSQAHLVRFEQDFGYNKIVILRLTTVYFIDLDGIDALDEIIDTIYAHQGRVIFVGIRPHIAAILTKQSKHYNQLLARGNVVATMQEAFVQAKKD